MKTNQRTIITTIFLLILTIIPFIPLTSKADQNRLSGKILLQVNRNGEAWYVNPMNDRRYYMGRPHDAFQLMRNLGLGISERDYAKFKSNGNIAPAKFAGRIFLRVEVNGEAYYVHPDTREMHYLGRPADAFRIMREFGLGITDEDLNGVLVFAENEGWPPAREAGKQAVVLGTPCENSREGYCEGNKSVSCGMPGGGIANVWTETECRSDQFCREEQGYLYNTARCFTPTPCHEPNYAMAFILLQKPDDRATARELEYMDQIKSEFARRFSWATRGLATMDTSLPVEIIEMPEDPKEEDVLVEFYRRHGDDYDFVTVYSSYDYIDIMAHVTVQNNVLGIGRPVFDNSNLYNEDNKKSMRLLGINWIDNIEMSLPENGSARTDEEIELSLILSVNGVLHETAHQWGANLEFVDENGKNDYGLRVSEHNVHWIRNFKTAVHGTLGGKEWIDNHDGTFTLKEYITNEEYKQAFINIDLYNMGLISKDEIEYLEIVSTNADKNDITQHKAVPADIISVSMEQIISAEGERLCVKHTDY